MRCKSCNTIMGPEEIVWYEDIKIHEELCRKCLEAIEFCTDEEENDEPLTYGIDYDDGEWDQLPPWEGDSIWDD